MTAVSDCTHPDFYRASSMGRAFCIGCRSDLGEDHRPTYFIRDSERRLVERHADDLPEEMLTGEREGLSERQRADALAELQCEVHEVDDRRRPPDAEGNYPKRKVVAKIADEAEFKRRAAMRRRERDPDEAHDARKVGDR